MNWISESEAAEKVNRQPRTLRQLVKKGEWKVKYSAPNGRKYFYCEQDLEKVLKQFSNT